MGSDELASAASAVADAIGLRLDVIRVEIDGGPSLEAMARRARYRALRDHIGEEGRILLGHTRNDQAETVLLNLIRGGATRGLAGMPYHRPPNLYRPFLDVTRDETRELATLAGLPFVDDPTNFDRSFRRNRVRLDIVPMLEDLNPNLIESLVRTADHLRIDADYLDRIAAEQVEPVVGEDVVSLPSSVLILLPAAIRSRALARMVGLLRAHKGLTSAEMERIEAVLFGVADAAELEGSLRVIRSGPYLECRRRR